jgi:hypothetical protein
VVGKHRIDRFIRQARACLLSGTKNRLETKRKEPEYIYILHYRKRRERKTETS